MSSIGITCACPPPAAPPFIPKHGPRLGSRRQTVVCLPILLRPSVRPTEVVVFPSPAGVGVTAVTRISFPSLFFWTPSIAFHEILALSCPKGTRSSLSMLSFAPISFMCSPETSLAISISVLYSLISSPNFAENQK